VVLSYAVEDRENPTVPTKAAICLAHRWWKKHPKASIIMSTGNNQRMDVSNSRVMVNYATKLGIPQKYLIEEDKSWDTVTNIKFTDQILQKKKFTRVIYVMYDLHVRRTLAIAKKMGKKDIHWISTASQGSPAYGIKFFQTYSRFTIFCYEILAYVYNRLKGEI